MYRYRYRRTRRYPRRQYVREQAVWPLPALNGHPPAIIAIDKRTREATLAYGVSPLDSAAGAPAPPPAHSFFMPECTPVLAMRSGVAWANLHDGVYRVSIDHGNGFGTDYEGLYEATVGTPERKRLVKAGEVIGTIRSPASAPCPLRFTLSRTDLIPGLPGLPCPVDPLDVLLGAVSIPLATTSAMPPEKEAA